jgi:hypothetical protein
LPTNSYTINGSNIDFVVTPQLGTVIQIRVLGGLIGPQGVAGVQGPTGTPTPATTQVKRLLWFTS